MTEDDRDAFNAKEYARFRGKGTTRNECEICGFVPYTKNKYREKQEEDQLRLEPLSYSRKDWVR